MDSVRTSFQSESLHQADQGRFGAAVMGAVGHAPKRGTGKCEHDASVFLRQHMRPSALSDIPRSKHVHGEHVIPLLRIDLGEGQEFENAGVADDDVDSAEPLDCNIDQ